MLLVQKITLGTCNEELTSVCIGSCVRLKKICIESICPKFAFGPNLPEKKVAWKATEGNRLMRMRGRFQR